MREIKFRAWNKKKKRMENDFAVTADGQPIKYCGLSDRYEDADYVLMQYTGLKDKSGVEIYEGDQIDDNFIGIGFIEYNEKTGAYRVNYNNGRAKYFFDFLGAEARNIEVIGNIHSGADDEA
jgi:uncharacterized phage protein (TIGR01671 family)